MTNEIDRNTGKAYTFFYSSATRREIEAEIPKARALAEVPGNLELELDEGINPERFEDSELREIAESAEVKGYNYSLHAILPNDTNTAAAVELGTIQGMLYSSPLQPSFHDDSGKVRMILTYKFGDEYLIEE
jgi:hypothetical protein